MLPKIDFKSCVILLCCRMEDKIKGSMCNKAENEKFERCLIRGSISHITSIFQVRCKTGY